MSNIVAKNADETSIMLKEINLLFPHQLFKENPLSENNLPIYLIEEFLFFKQLAFHKQKIAFHRASMKSYANYLKKQGKKVFYISSNEPQSDLRIFLSKNKELEVVHFIDPTDNWLQKSFKKFSSRIELIEYRNPLFLNGKVDVAEDLGADDGRKTT